MNSFALYRLPYQSVCTMVEQTEGEPAGLLSCTELNGRSGFVVAPFQTKASQPILLIRPDKVRTIPCTPEAISLVAVPVDLAVGEVTETPTSSKAIYSVDFANFHSQLETGAFSKIVLARCSVESRDADTSPFRLFASACRRYPRMFIALVYTPVSGLWLVATPEILLEGGGADWRTIALAGTMKLEGEQLGGEGEDVAWTVKNIEEQRIVATYITECLEQFTNDFQESGPRTVRAANLVHLRSDFSFRLADSSRLGELLQTLHPTPAVCGLPKRRAFDFIVSNENWPRRYYSGFMGPLSIGTGEQADTHLYVSLRCMNIARDTYYLYAGGGLLRDSLVQSEWLETEAKLETMRGLLDEAGV